MRKDEKDSLGYYLDEIGKFSVLSANETNYLFKKYHEGDQEAKQKLIESNLRLVITVAENYVHKGLDLEDLINAGNIGLINAVDSYNLNSKAKFSTFAFRCIQNSIIEELDKTSRTIRLPHYVFKQLNDFRKAKMELRKILGHDPSLNEIKDAIDIPMEKIIILDKYNKHHISCTYNEFDSVIENSYDNLEVSPEDMYLDKEKKEEVNQMIEEANLSPSEQIILYARYGLNKNLETSRKDLAKQFHISYEAIRQWEIKAIKKVARTQNAENFINNEADLKHLNKVRNSEKIKIKKKK